MLNPTDSTERAADQSAARIPSDMMVSAVILVFCVITFMITFTFKEAPAVVAQNVQPATFPKLVIVIVGILAAISGFLSLRRAQSKKSPIPAMVFITAAVMIAFVILFTLLGIVPAMALLCFSLPVIWGERRWHIIVPYSIGFPALVYFIFVVLLKVHFETSPLVFW